MIRTILLTVLAVVFTMHSLKAQPEVKIHNVIVSPGEILVQLDMINFTGSNTFKSVSLEVGFNDDLLVFNGITNQTIAGTWFSNESGGGSSPLVVTFSNMGSAQSLNGKLLDLRFTYFGGFSTPLIFLTQFCEVASGNLEPINNIIYTNGSISQSEAKGNVAMENLLSPAGAVLMPVNMGGTGFENISHTRFRIAYDDSRLDFQGIQNATLPGYSASASDGILTFEWTGSSQNFSINTKVFDVAFNFDGSSNASLEFLPGSFVKSGSDFIATAYFNGMFESLLRNWTGAIDSDWHNPGNWSGAIPGENDVALIPATSNNPVISGNAETEQLTIESGAAVTITPAGTLTVNGPLLNNAGSSSLLIRSDETGTGSLIYESGTVPATVERYIDEAFGIWKQLSSPVTEQNIETDFSNGNFFAWHEPAQTWVSYSNTMVWPTWNEVNTLNSEDGNFIPGKGYLVSYSGNPTKEFTGTLSHGSVSFILHNQAHPDDAFQGFNLAGNPYPSSIDWKAPDGWSGRNNLQTEGGGYTIWVWNGSIGNYGTYNSASLIDEGTNSVSRYIAPMQGFWVKAENHLGVLEMNNNVRTHSTQEWLKGTPALADVLRLKVSSTASKYSDETIIEFGHESDMGGASKMHSIVTEAPALYSITEGKPYAISFLNDISENPYVNLGFEAGTEAVYTIALSNSDFFHDIIIEDLRDGRKQKLAIDMPYHFSAKTTDEPNRFVLHFKALGTDPLDLQPALNAWVYDRTLYISNPGEEKAVAEVYNTSGMLLNTSEVNGQGLHSLPMDLPPGIYMLKLQNKHLSTKAKFLVF